MKTCPVCGETYSERIDFCFGDGAVLKLMPSAMDAPAPRASSGGVSALAPPSAPRRSLPPPDASPVVERSVVPSVTDAPRPPAAPAIEEEEDTLSTTPPPVRREGGRAAAPKPDDGEGLLTEPPPRRESNPPPPAPADAPDEEDAFFTSGSVASPSADHAEPDTPRRRRSFIPWGGLVAAAGTALLFGVFSGKNDTAREAAASAATAAPVAAVVAPEMVPEPAEDPTEPAQQEVREEAPGGEAEADSSREGPESVEFDDAAAAVGVDVGEPAVERAEGVSTGGGDVAPVTPAPRPMPRRPVAPAPRPQTVQVQSGGSLPTTTTSKPPSKTITVTPPAPGAVAPAASSPWDAPTAATPVGRTTFTSDPAGASVRIDGKVRGRTPLTIELEHGTYDIELTLDGYRTYSRSVTIASDSPKFPARLDPLVRTGNVLVVAEGWEGAQLYVDGRVRGRVPTQVSLEEGTHTFVLKLGDQARTSQRMVRLAASGVTRVDLSN